MISAEKILKENWDNTLPVNPAAIAGKMGITVIADPTLGEASGGYEPAQGDSPPIIRFNPLEAIVRQRFTVAHEIAHHVLGHGARHRDTSANFTLSADPHEVEANKFAAELLMPEEDVHALILVKKICRVAELASKFNVSKLAMKYRVEKLGYAVN